MCLCPAMPLKNTQIQKSLDSSNYETTIFCSSDLSRHRRKGDGEGGAGAGGTLCANGAAVRFHGMFHNGEAKSGTLHSSCFIGAVETIEDVGQIFRLNTDAVIAHADRARTVLIAARRHRQLQPGRRIVFQRILQQVKEDLRPVE